MRKTILIGAVLATLAVPASASAEKTIKAETMWRYDAATYTIEQGEALKFVNADALSPGPHDVTARDKGADGTPAFKSDTVEHGAEVPVKGAEALQPGSYGFFCSVHPFMEATLMVSAKAGPPPTPTPDTRAPVVNGSIAPTNLSRAVTQRRFQVRVGADEPAQLTLKLTARVGRRNIAVGTGTATIAEANRTRGLSIRMTARAAKRLKKAKRAIITLTVQGRDQAGNVGTASVRRTVKQR